MTEKVFETLPYAASCEAEVIDVKYLSGEYYIALNRTCMFPEGGGQPSDTGRIDGIPVLSLKEDNGIIYHICEKGFQIGSKVCVSIDFEHRFRYMQLHTAEHIVSGIIYNEYGFKNIGFHMHGSIATIDLAGEINAEMLNRIELLSNKAVTDNIKVEALYPEDISKINARKYPETNEPIRIVRIPGIDSCGCCGVHVARTGEIGLIKALTSERHRGGTRMTLVCGAAAFADYQLKHSIVMENAAKFSVKPEGLSASIDKFTSETENLKYKLSQANDKLYDYICRDIANSTDNDICIYTADSLASDELLRFTVKLASHFKAALVFTEQDSKTRYAIVSTEKEIDARKICKLINSEFDGKGGGKPEVCQGYIAKGDPKAASEYIKNTIDSGL